MFVKLFVVLFVLVVVFGIGCVVGFCVFRNILISCIWVCWDNLYFVVIVVVCELKVLFRLLLLVYNVDLNV